MNHRLLVAVVPCVLSLLPTLGYAREIFAIEPASACAVAYDVDSNTARVVSGGPAAIGSGAALKSPQGIALRPWGHLLVIQGDDGTKLDCLDVNPVDGHRTLLSSLSRTGDLVPGSAIYATLPDGRVVLHATSRSTSTESCLILDPVSGTLQPAASPESPPSHSIGRTFAGDATLLFDPGSLRVDQWNPVSGDRQARFPQRFTDIVPSPTELVMPTIGTATRTFDFSPASPALAPAPVELLLSTRNLNRLNPGIGVLLEDPTGTEHRLLERATGYPAPYGTREYPTEFFRWGVYPLPSGAFAGAWHLHLITGAVDPSTTQYPPTILSAELRTTNLSTIVAAGTRDGDLVLVDLRGRVAQVHQADARETLISTGTENALSPPFGRAAGLVPLDSGDVLLIEHGTGRVVRVAASDGTRAVVGNIFPAGLVPAGQPATGATVHGLAITEPVAPSEASNDPSLVLSTLDETQWESLALAPLFSAPTFSTDGGLGLGAGDPTNTFGFWQTRAALRPPPAGRYLITVRLAGSLVSAGRRHPELRGRVFPADNQYAAMGLCAETAAGAGLDSSVEIEWSSDGVTPWRVALDILSFATDQEGGVTITSITNERLVD